MFRSTSTVRPTSDHLLMMALVAGLGYTTWLLRGWYAPALPLAMLAYALIVVWRSSRTMVLPDARPRRHLRRAAIAVLVGTILAPLASSTTVTIAEGVVMALALITAAMVLLRHGRDGTSRLASAMAWFRTALTMSIVWAIVSVIDSIGGTASDLPFIADTTLRRIATELFIGPPLPALVAILLVWATLAMRLDDGDVHAPEQEPKPGIRTFLSPGAQVGLIVGGITAVVVSPALPWVPVGRFAVLLIGAILAPVGMAPLCLATLRYLPTLLHRVSGSTIPLVATAITASTIHVGSLVLDAANLILWNDPGVAVVAIAVRDVAASLALATALPAALEQWAAWRISLRVAVAYTAVVAVGIMMRTAAIAIPPSWLGYGWSPDLVATLFCGGAAFLLLRAAPSWQHADE